jgi:hypothetical protein
LVLGGIVTGPLALVVNTVAAMQLEMSDLGAPLPTEVEIFDHESDSHEVSLHAAAPYPRVWANGCILWSDIERLVPVRIPVAS